MLTLEDKKFVVQQWNITGSWIAIRRAFLKRPGYHAKNLPALSSLKLVVNKFNEFGSITNRRKGKKSAITSTEIKKWKGYTETGNLFLYALRQDVCRYQGGKWGIFFVLGYWKRHTRVESECCLQRDSVRPELQLPDIYSLTRLPYPKRGLQTNPGFIRMASLKRYIKSFGNSKRKLLSLFQANWNPWKWWYGEQFQPKA